MRGLPRTLARQAARDAGLPPPVAGLKAVTTGVGGQYKTVITLQDLVIAVTSASKYASQKLFDFAAGKVRIKGGTASLAFAVTTARASTINDSAAMDWSIGSVAASSVTLASTMVDVIAKQDKALDGAVAAYTTAQAADLAAAATYDGTTTPVDIFLNIGFPTATDVDGNGTITVSGTITILHENWGDNA